MIKPALYQLTSAFSILNTDFFNCILSRYHYHTHVLTPNTYIRIVQYCREGAYTYTSQFEVQTMAICLNALLGEGASMSLLRVLYSFFQTLSNFTDLSVWHRTQRRSSSASLCNVKYEMVLSGQIINRVRCLRKQNAVMGMCKCRKWLVPDQWRPVGTYWTWCRGYAICQGGDTALLLCWGSSPPIVLRLTEDSAPQLSGVSIIVSVPTQQSLILRLLSISTPFPVENCDLNLNWYILYSNKP